MDDEKRPGTAPDPNDSPFEVPPIEGIPFDKDSEEARAIERILAWDSQERVPTPGETQPNQEPDPNGSPFEVPPIGGIPLDKDTEEARAIERILAWGEPEQAPAGADK